MKQINRLISVLLALALVIGFMPQIALGARAAAYIAPQPPKAELQATDSGTCGKYLTWTLDVTGVLTISGTGRMEDYSHHTIPWYGYRDIIQSVVIEDGVTSICNWAFNACSNLTSVTIPESVTSIGNGHSLTAAT